MAESSKKIIFGYKFRKNKTVLGCNIEIPNLDYLNHPYSDLIKLIGEKHNIPNPVLFGCKIPFSISDSIVFDKNIDSRINSKMTIREFINVFDRYYRVYEGDVFYHLSTDAYHNFKKRNYIHLDTFDGVINRFRLFIADEYSFEPAPKPAKI